MRLHYVLVTLLLQTEPYLALGLAAPLGVQRELALDDVVRFSSLGAQAIFEINEKLPRQRVENDLADIDHQSPSRHVGFRSSNFAFCKTFCQKILDQSIGPLVRPRHRLVCCMGVVGRQDGWRFLPLLVTLLDSGLCAFVASRFIQGPQGSGVPQAIAARHLGDDDERSDFLSLRIAAGKIVMTMTGQFCGASIGRWGTHGTGRGQVTRWGGMVQARGLILTGSAAGIAAAFSPPLAGIVFAIGEMSRTSDLLALEHLRVRDSCRADRC